MTSAVLALDPAAAPAIVDRAITAYVAGCHARVPDFVERHFSVRGSLALHRHALGWDLARAPANLLLAVPQLGVQAAAAGLRGLGGRGAARRLAKLSLVRETAVARALAQAIERELLQLDPDDPARPDGMAQALAADPTVAAAFDLIEAAAARSAADGAFRRQLELALSRYAGTRAAAADIATALTSLGIGALAFKQITPSLISLGPLLAAAIAQNAAVTGFPLGSGLGGLWYSWFPVAPGTALVAGVTGGLLLGAAVLTAFSGVVTDPAQKALGLHRRRLDRLVEAVGHGIRTGEGLGFNPRDQLVARLVDLIDIARTAHRLLNGG